MDRPLLLWNSVMHIMHIQDPLTRWATPKNCPSSDPTHTYFSSELFVHPLPQ